MKSPAMTRNRRLERMHARWAAFMATTKCRKCGGELVNPPPNEFVRCINGHPYDRAW